jgi:predicted DNA-binding transcriptional regulator YafY
VLETSARLLRLLSFLQSHRDWSGEELARRMQVTTRTVRRDVDRLRQLGYPVDATPGAGGGYRLGAGAVMPPLLLDDDEAIAVAVGLRSAAIAGISGIEETSVRALTKLEHVLPSRLRRRVQTLQSAIVPMPGRGPTVDPDVLLSIAAAARDHLQLRVDYRSHDGTESRRVLEPHRIVHSGRRWYLVAWDVDRQDWRTFRVDRVTPRTPTGPRFAPRDAPAPDLARYTSEGITTRVYRYRARLTVHAPATAVSDYMPPTIAVVTPLDDHTSELVVGANSLEELVIWVGLMGLPFTIEEPPELVDVVRRLASVLHAAAINSEA